MNDNEREGRRLSPQEEEDARDVMEGLEAYSKAHLAEMREELAGLKARGEKAERQKELLDTISSLEKEVELSAGYLNELEESKE